MDKLTFCTLILKQLHELDACRPLKDDYIIGREFRKESYKRNLYDWESQKSVLLKLLNTTISEAYAYDVEISEAYAYHVEE